VSGEFGEQVASCATLSGVQEVFCREIERHGYTASACRAFVPADDGTRSQILFRNWPQDWAKLSDRKGFSASSFVIAEARKRMSPFSWFEAKDARILSPGEQEIWDAAVAWGWKNGFVVPVHGPEGYFATVSMASREPDLDLSPGKRSRLYMLAILAHERCCALAAGRSNGHRHSALSAREIECLRWVAAGKTDWEIGTILSISATTVKFHVNSARAKLGARTRAQAVARLVLSGLY
jgi:DNA-binding CsgD family transcriptional regulator